MDNVRACRIKVEEAFKMAEAHYNVTIPRVPVKFNNRMSRTAGHAVYSRSILGSRMEGIEIDLSFKLLNLNGQEFIDRTPGHEAAHIIAVHLFQENGQGHGRRWQEVMGVIGQPATQKHNMDTPHRRPQTTYRYVATCGEVFQMSGQRHRKLQKGAIYGVRDGGQITKACFSPANPTPIQARVIKSRKTFPSVPKTTPPARKGTSKAALFRAAVKPLKAAGVSMEEIMANTQVVEMLAKASGLPAGNIASGLRHHWSKI